MEQPKSINFVKQAVSFIGGIAATVIASYIFLVFTDKVPILNYEVISATNFQTQNSSLSIVNIRISNTGTKEATNVNGLVEINVPGNIIEMNTSRSSKAIEFLAVKDTINTVKFDAPLSLSRCVSAFRSSALAWLDASASAAPSTGCAHYTINFLAGVMAGVIRYGIKKPLLERRGATKTNCL